MDYTGDLAPAIHDKLPDGPDLTAWLLTELDRADAAAARWQTLGCERICRGPQDTLTWIAMMRALVLQHQAGPTHVTDMSDPTEPDVLGGWHCQECGLDRDGPTDDWPCEILVMIATLLWQTQWPGLPIDWAWTAPDDELSWRREDVEEHPTGVGRDPVAPGFTTDDIDRVGQEFGANGARTSRGCSVIHVGSPPVVQSGRAAPSQARRYNPPLPM